ncbi:hypothetical protein AUJ68_01705 [Candidatus Woesearchaeota archaeon CG1_02_57_44]|nr:MAG: hypothetical protein AUJ68_01705 [Candidatus Woesearchaeota archaeon CG1_02_57_44]
MTSGAIKRYGSRYGRKTRHRLDAVETLQKAKYECPACNQIAAKRVSAGIWECRKCQTKFAGGAYQVKKVQVVMEQAGKAYLESFEMEE